MGWTFFPHGVSPGRVWEVVLPFSEGSGPSVERSDYTRGKDGWRRGGGEYDRVGPERGYGRWGGEDGL